MLTGWFWHFAQGMLAFVIIWALVSTVNGPLLKLLLRRTSHVAAQTRVRLCFWLGLLPMMVACAAVVTLSVPELAASFNLEHCHQDHCGAHRPWLGSSGLVAFTLATCVVLIGVALAALATRTIRRIKRLRALLQLAERDPRLRYWLLDSPRLMAWTIGLLNTRVLLSTGLRKTLTEAQLERVLQHEFAHLERRDNLWKFILSKSLWCSPHRRYILAQYARDCEILCEHRVAGGRQQTLATPGAAPVWLALVALAGLAFAYLWSSTAAYHLLVEAVFARIAGLGTA